MTDCYVFKWTRKPKGQNNIIKKEVLDKVTLLFTNYYHNIYIHSNHTGPFYHVLLADTINEKLKEFLIARNPKHQHSATLDSYLIKPIQRILKYPLLLQQLCNLTDPESDEHHHLSGM
ncbi:hypothetical protein DPMN_042163 [Dreissena polymorpha]|uniref:DH domain-containing protein n=1 Tax=Dreissena polymorpha TaxID=45954 RepID=A0A9D4CY41_DREPO|nr:hypothetical protein DPMN_042163 [Dreissena polymorpha]